MPPYCIGPPSPREVNDQTLSPTARDEFAPRVKNHEAFLRGSVEPLPCAIGGFDSQDPDHFCPVAQDDWK
jgi:hypothetical protein